MLELRNFIMVIACYDDVINIDHQENVFTIYYDVKTPNGQPHFGTFWIVGSLCGIIQTMLSGTVFKPYIDHFRQHSKLDSSWATNPGGSFIYASSANLANLANLPCKKAFLMSSWWRVQWCIAAKDRCNFSYWERMLHHYSQAHISRQVVNWSILPSIPTW